MNPNKPSPQAPDETLMAKKAALETEALELIEDTEQRLKHEKNLETLKLLELRRQELRNILFSLAVPTEVHLATAAARIEELRKDPLSVGTHEFVLRQQKNEPPQNLEQPIDLETEVANLIKETERQLRQEMNPLTQELLEMHLQDLKNIQDLLRAPKVKGRARIQAQLQAIREQSLSSMPHAFPLYPRNNAQAENGANP